MNIRSKLRGIRELWQFDNRWWLIMTRAFFPGESIQIYNYRGNLILCDHEGGDANGAREVLTSPMYSRFLSSMDLDHPLRILDLGANNGGFPLLLKSRGLEIESVVSVELNPRTYLRLQFNLLRNIGPQAKPLNAAVCGENSTIDVVLGLGGSSDSILVEQDGPNAKRFKVDGMSIDEIMGRYFIGPIDICKIDIEGAEFQVFEGNAYRALSRCRYVIMEIHEIEGKSSTSIIEALTSLGFYRHDTNSGADPAIHFFENMNLGHD